MQPLEASLIRILPGIIQACQDRVFAEYHETYSKAQGDNNEIETQPSEDSTSLISQEPPAPTEDSTVGRILSSYRQRPEFLHKAFEPPLNQQSSSSAIPILETSSLSIPRLSASKDTMYSDSGYGGSELVLSRDCTHGHCSFNDVITTVIVGSVLLDLRGGLNNILYDVTPGFQRALPN